MEIALQGSAWNMVLMPELFSVINTGGPKVPPSCIWGPGFHRPLFPSDQNLPWEVSQGLVMSNDASLVEGCYQDLLHSHRHRDVGCTGIQRGESATSWCLLHETLFISYAGALRLPN